MFAVLGSIALVKYRRFNTQTEIKEQSNSNTTGNEDVYFEMGSKQAANAGIYDDIAEESGALAIPTNMRFEKQGADTTIQRQTSTESVYSGQPDAVMVQRLLYILAAVVAISFLTSAATLILALTMMTSRNGLTASADCAALKGKRNRDI